MSDLDDPTVLAQAVARFDVSPIIRRFGTWAVTNYGVEALTTYYPIELARVTESDWLAHMRSKTWVDMRDFAAALEFANELHRTREQLKVDGRALKVFLCHANEDKSQVRDLWSKLVTLGVEPWFDEQTLLPGQNWKLEISRGLRNSDIVVICLSAQAVKKTGYVQREIKEALEAAAERPEGQIFIIPALFDECVIPDSLTKFQWVDLSKPDGIDRLVRAFRHHADSRK